MMNACRNIVLPALVLVGAFLVPVPAAAQTARTVSSIGPTTREAALVTDVMTLQAAHVAGLMVEVAACMDSLGIAVPRDIPVPTVLLEPGLTPWIFEYWRPPSAASPAADVILLRPEFRTSDALVKHGLMHYLVWRATGQVGGHPSPPFDNGCGEF